MASEWIGDNLSMAAQAAGLNLLWHRDPYNNESVTLLNEHRDALYYWPYTPSLTEAREKADEILNEGRT